MKLGNHPQQPSIPNSQYAQDIFDQTEMIYQDVRKSAMQAYNKKKLNATKGSTLQSSKRQNMYMSYSRKRIIKGVKFHLQDFGGLARKLLKRWYLTTIIWYAKMAPT